MEALPALTETELLDIGDVSTVQNQVVASGLLIRNLLQIRYKIRRSNFPKREEKKDTSPIFKTLPQPMEIFPKCESYSTRQSHKIIS